MASKDSIVNQKDNNNPRFRNLTLYFREYCQSSSIHGFKYLSTDENRLSCEKIWWIVSMLISLILCITLVFNTYLKWQNSPVIVSFATKETPIWQIPFPAVTICAETKAQPNKFNYQKFFAMKKENKTLDHEDDQKFGLISLLCNYDETSNTNTAFNGTEEDILQFYDQVQPDFYKIISDCKFMRKLVDCSELFVPVFTDVGICYSFNILDREVLYRNNVVHYKNFHIAPESNWSLENGYSIEDEKLTYPRRALFAGVLFSLEAKLTVYEEELDYVCKDSIHGFQVQISQPSRIPTPKYLHSKVGLDQAVMMTLQLDKMSTSDAIKNYHPRRRNCYMSNERTLKFFKVYSQQNCKLECRTNHTLLSCNCSVAFMPREKSTRICDGMDYHCVYTAEMDQLNASIEGSLLKLKGQAKSTECDCLPICSKLNYLIESEQFNWDWKRIQPNYTDGQHMSMFKIFFKDNQFITSERNELFGPIDFLANLGGVLGLFIGFSLLSLIEIIYYLTLKLAANFKLFGKKNWSGHVS